MAVNTQNLGGELGSQGYTIGTLSYPDGLGVAPDLQHYVTFFIKRNWRHPTKNYDK